MSDHHQDHQKEIDSVTGVETTGHEWDGIKELNTPAPRWWLTLFYITIVWAIGYWVFYPAWPIPGGATKGVLDTNQYKALAESQAEIAARQTVWMEKFSRADFNAVMNDPDLYAFALAGGAAAFKDNCTVCHGTGAAGGRGYPNLNDDDWLWSGTVEGIYRTIQYGVRSGHDEARVSAMPAFGRDGMLQRSEIEQVADYVLALSSGKASADMPGAAVFTNNCAACHGEQGQGGRDFGAPNLSDSIWLYGGTHADIFAQVNNPKHGVMPYWTGRLDDQTLRELALYIHSLGGGEKSESAPSAPAAPAPVSEPEK